jgi:hypothetical protein
VEFTPFSVEFTPFSVEFTPLKETRPVPGRE